MGSPANLKAMLLFDFCTNVFQSCSVKLKYGHLASLIEINGINSVLIFTLNTFSRYNSQFFDFKVTTFYLRTQNYFQNVLFSKFYSDLKLDFK